MTETPSPQILDDSVLTAAENQLMLLAQEVLRDRETKLEAVTLARVGMNILKASANEVARRVIQALAETKKALPVERAHFDSFVERRGLTGTSEFLKYFWEKVRRVLTLVDSPPPTKVEV